MQQKKFECIRYYPTTTCTFTLIGDEDVVVEDATKHLIKAHNEVDTPQLRDNIRQTLVDV